MNPPVIRVGKLCQKRHFGASNEVVPGIWRSGLTDPLLGRVAMVSGFQKGPRKGV
jgi:hypothetical protein